MGKQQQMSAEAEALEKELNPGGEQAGGGESGGEAGAGAAKPGEGAAGTEAGKKKTEEGAGGAGKPDDDPEIDLTKYGFGKVKKSTLKAWQEGGLKEEDYRKKTEELSGREAQIKELMELSDYLAKNPKKLTKVLEVLDAADEAIEAGAKPGAGEGAKKEVVDAQAQIKAILDKLDPEDPMSLVFKAMYQDLQETKQILMGFKTREQQLQQTEQEQKLAQDLNYAKGVLQKTFDGLVKELKFESEEEKELWRQNVVLVLKKQNKDFGNEEAFVKAVKEAGQTVYKKIRSIAEAALKKHLESNGKGPKLPGQGASGAGAAGNEKSFTMENLQENLEAALEEAASQNK